MRSAQRARARVYTHNHVRWGGQEESVSTIINNDVHNTRLAAFQVAEFERGSRVREREPI